MYAIIIDNGYGCLEIHHRNNNKQFYGSKKKAEKDAKRLVDIGCFTVCHVIKVIGTYE